MNYPDSQWERIMKIQDVFVRAYNNKLTWKEAAVLRKVDERTIRRWKETVDQNGYEALLDKRTLRPSPKKASQTIGNQVLKLYRDSYRDWNVKHFHEQLAQHGISTPRLLFLRVGLSLVNPQFRVSRGIATNILGLKTFSKALALLKSNIANQNTEYKSGYGP